jgi:hypothetical protein
LVLSAAIDALSLVSKRRQQSGELLVAFIISRGRGPVFFASQLTATIDDLRFRNGSHTLRPSCIGMGTSYDDSFRCCGERDSTS